MKMRIVTVVLLVSLLVVVVNGDRDDRDDHDGRGGRGGRRNPKVAKGLEMDFYRSSCSQFEEIVRDVTQRTVKKDPTMAAKLLRIHYHDCFVRGCDASILLDEVNGNNATEKTAGPNRSIAGYEIIDEIKAKLEKVCPDTVSCADIVAVSARDAISVAKGEDLWPVYTGRRDGRVSLATEALTDLPSGGSNFQTLLKLFKRFNLNKEDLVALSGAHTIGVARCAVVIRRISNFTGKGDADPDLSPEYVEALKAKCVNPTVRVGLDRDSFLNFDSHYYSGLNRKEGLLTSDSALLKDKQAQNLVNKFTDFETFKKAFANSMINMGNIDVMTGKRGEIRKNCRMIN